MTDCNRSSEEYGNVPLPGIRKTLDHTAASGFDIIEVPFAAIAEDVFSVTVPASAVRFELRTKGTKPARLQGTSDEYKITGIRVFLSGPLNLDSDLTLNFKSAYTGDFIQLLYWE